MNKLLSSKVLALSMLALVAGEESWGMQQNLMQDNFQTNMSKKIVIQIPSNVFPGGNISWQGVGLLESSSSYQWFARVGVTSLEGIKIICREVKKYAPIGIIRSLTGALSKTKICAWLDPNWSELSPIFDRVEIIPPTSLPSHKSSETRRKNKELQGWNRSSSVSVRWADQNGIKTQRDLLAATSAAISLSGQKIIMNRYTKQDMQLLFKFLDDNWETLGTWLERIYCTKSSRSSVQPQPTVLQNQPLPTPPIRQQNQQQPQQTQETQPESETNCGSTIPLQLQPNPYSIAWLLNY